MAGMGTIGNVLNAIQRMPVSIHQEVITRAWTDSHATALIRYNGYGDPVDGDCVTMNFSFTGLQETRFYQAGQWLGMEQFIDPATEFCAPCGGKGFREIPFITGPITCPDCGGSGRPAAKTSPTQPGIDDEVKPDLMSKKLRSW